MSKFSIPPNSVVIQIEDKNTVDVGGVELEIITKFRPEDWWVNEGILVDFSTVLVGDEIQIGLCKKHHSYFQKTLEKLKLGRKVYFHPSDVLNAIKNKETTKSGNAFRIGKNKYFILGIEKLFAIQIRGEVVALNDMAFVTPILTEEPKSSSGLLYLPASNLPKYVPMKGIYNGSVVYIPINNQIRTHSIDGNEYFVMHESHIVAVESFETGVIEPTNNIIFLKLREVDKVGSIILPEEYKQKLQISVRGTILWVGEILKASKMATLILRESGMNRVVGTEVYCSGGFALEMEVDGQNIFAINVKGITEENIVAFTENKPNKELVYDNNHSNIKI